MRVARILHVDDEPDIREVVGISLALDTDLIVRSCASGAEALEAACDWLPDLILLDVMMPGMDGPTTLSRLNKGPLTSGIPVVFMTARAQTRELDHFKSLGAAGVIPKPFDPMGLAAAVRGFLRPQPLGFDSMQSEFVDRARRDAAELLLCQGDLAKVSPAPDTLVRVRDVAHRLAGAGGIFGFGAISADALAVEEAVTRGVPAGQIDSVISRLLDQIASLAQADLRLQ